MATKRDIVEAIDVAAPRAARRRNLTEALNEATGLYRISSFVSSHSSSEVSRAVAD